MILDLIFIIFIIYLLLIIPALPDNREYFYYNYDEIINNVISVEITCQDDDSHGNTYKRIIYTLPEENIDDFLMDVCTIKFYVNDEETDYLLNGMYICINYENDEVLIIDNMNTKYNNIYCSFSDLDSLLTKYYYLADELANS